MTTRVAFGEFQLRVTLSPATIEVAVAENDEPVAVGQARTVTVVFKFIDEQGLAPLAVSVYVVVVVGATAAVPELEKVPVTPLIVTLVALGTFQLSRTLVPAAIKA